MQSNVGIRTYCNRDIINFIVNVSDNNDIVISLLKKMLTTNPKEQYYTSLFHQNIGNNITAVTIQFYYGLKLELVQDIVHIVEQYDFVKHAAFVLNVKNNNNINAAKSLIYASAKCTVYNDDIEANAAAAAAASAQIEELLQNRIF